MIYCYLDAVLYLVNKYNWNNLVLIILSIVLTASLLTFIPTQYVLFKQDPSNFISFQNPCWYFFITILITWKIHHHPQINRVGLISYYNCTSILSTIFLLLLRLRSKCRSRPTCSSLGYIRTFYNDYLFFLDRDTNNFCLLWVRVFDDDLSPFNYWRVRIFQFSFTR